jgi:hypothetical protein
MRRPQGSQLAYIVVLLAWLGLMLYVWLWSRVDWGVGWALAGTINLTFVALFALFLIWLIGRARGRARGSPPAPRP